MKNRMQLGLLCCLAACTTHFAPPRGSWFFGGTIDHAAATIDEKTASILQSVSIWINATYIKLTYLLGNEDIPTLAQSFTNSTGAEKQEIGRKLLRYLDSAQLITQDTIDVLTSTFDLLQDTQIPYGSNQNILHALRDPVRTHAVQLTNASRAIQIALQPTRPTDLPAQTAASAAGATSDTGYEDCQSIGSQADADDELSTARGVTEADRNAAVAVVSASATPTISIPNATTLKSELAPLISAVDGWCQRNQNEKYQAFRAKWTTCRSIASFREYGCLREDLSQFVNDEFIKKHLTDDASTLKTLMTSYITGERSELHTVISKYIVGDNSELRRALAELLQTHLGYPTLNAWIGAKIRWPARIAYCIGAGAIIVHTSLAAHAHYRNIYQKAPAEPTTQQSLHLFKRLSVKENPILFALLLLLTLSSCVNATHSILDMLS